MAPGYGVSPNEAGLFDGFIEAAYSFAEKRT
jgi:hypothetical protein